MFTVIFGRPGCPYCVRAKELAEKLSNERDDFNYRYIDIHAEGISKADLEKPWVNRLKPYRRFLSIRSTLAAALTLKPGRKRISACSPETAHSSDECLRLVSSQAQINKKHSAPSAHQNTALNSHASSCQKERSVTKKSRITTRQTGAASIAPISGRSTRCPGERQLAAAPGSKKNSSPSSG